MKDPHQNLFFYYRGPSTKAKSSSYDFQVEDNTTKSLINTLEFLSLNEFDHLRIALFKKLRLKNEPVLFYKLQQHEEQSRPDVLIHLQTYKVIIEVKVASPLKKGQLRRHLMSLESNDYLLVITNHKNDMNLVNSLKDKRVLYMTWADIYSICVDTANFYHAKKKFKFHVSFINHFIEYLEGVVMTEFSGFRNQDFDFFLEYNKHYAPILKGKLDKLAQSIKDKLPSDLKQYSDIKVGNIPKKLGNFKGAWVAIKKPANKKDILNQCNFTLEMNSSHFSINAVIRNGRTSQKKTPLGIFHKVLNEGTDILRTLKKIGTDAFIVMYKRKSRSGKRPYPAQGDEKWVEYFSMDINDISTLEDIKLLSSALQKADFPGIHIKRSINRGNPILTKPKDLTNLILKTLVDFSPVLDTLYSTQNKL